jgi:serine/threonine protein kinase, bacterial
MSRTTVNLFVMKVVCTAIAAILIAVLIGCSKKGNPSPTVGIVSTFAQGPLADTSDGVKSQAVLDVCWGITTAADGSFYVTDNRSNIIRVTPQGVASYFSGNITGAFYYSNIYAEPFGIAADVNSNLYVSSMSIDGVLEIAPNGMGALLAGSGEIGSMNGVGIAATFRQPRGVATDAAGNVYVSEDYTIRKITPSGLVTTFAGNDLEMGNVDGPVSTATFKFPDGIAIDANNVMYVADTENQEIRKIKDGVVSTIAGNGTQGSANGTGANATFNYPIGIAVDNSGNIYVADTNNNLIRKITQSGVVSTLAGTGEAGFLNGPADKAMFNLPWYLTIGHDGNLYVTDNAHSMIRKITLN